MFQHLESYYFQLQGPMWQLFHEVFTVTEEGQSQIKAFLKYIGGGIRHMGYSKVGMSLKGLWILLEYILSFLVGGH